MPANLRERKKERTREALVQAALDLFADRGFDHVTVEEIAAACEVSPRTFFRYFGSKEDVLFADSDSCRRDLLDALDGQAADVSPPRALEAAMRVVAHDYADQRDLLRARHAIVASTPSLRTRTAERQQGWEAEVIEHLRASGRAGETSDLDLRLLVATITAALRVAIEIWLAAGANDDLNDLLDSAFRRLHAGLDT